MNEHTHFILSSACKGVFGMAGSLLAVVMPWQEQLEWGVRVAGALAGIAVAVLTSISLVQGIIAKHKSSTTRHGS